jgi:hypothetical protein
MLGKILGSALGSALAGLFKALFGWITARQTRRDQIELGQARQKTVDLEANAAAAKRVQEAQAAPRGRGVTQKNMDEGTF